MIKLLELEFMQNLAASTVELSKKVKERIKEVKKLYLMNLI